MPDEPMALIPYPIIQGLIAEGENTDGNTTLLESLKKHKQRLENKAYMYYWKGVMSFSPKHILSSRRIRVEERPIITVEVANDLFQSGQPLFHITEEEWSSYIHMYVAKFFTGNLCCIPRCRSGGKTLAPSSFLQFFVPLSTICGSHP